MAHEQITSYQEEIINLAKWCTENNLVLKKDLKNTETPFFSEKHRELWGF